MKNLLFGLCTLFSIGVLFSQSTTLSGKYVIDQAVTYEGDVKTSDVDIAKSGECLYYYTFFESGKLIISGFDDDDCAEEVSFNGAYTILGNVLTISIEGDMESYYIEDSPKDTLILSQTEEESRGFGGYITIKYQLIYKKV